MEYLSPQAVSASKLPILNPNKFDLWKMRIEQYFLMTDYSLWEVILNGDSPAPTMVIEGVVQHVSPTTAKQRLARKNELKAHEKRFGGNKETKKVQKTLLKQQYENFTCSIPRSLPTEWRTPTLIWRNKTDLEEQSLDDLFNSLKIYEAEIKSSFSASTSTQNIVVLSSSNTDRTNDPVSAAASVSAVSTKIYVSALPNVDTLSNAFIYSFFASQSSSPQLYNDDLKHIDADNLEEMNLNWQMSVLTVRSRRFFQRTRRNLGEIGPTSMGFDTSKVECYNCHRKGHFARECRSPKDTRRNGAAEPQRRNVPVDTSTSNALGSQCDGVGSYDWSFQAEEEPTNYALMAFTSSSSFSSNNESDESLPPSPIYNRYQSGDEYHAVSPPYTGTFMPPKPDLFFHKAPNVNETVHTAFNVELSLSKPENDLCHTHRPLVPIIEDWVSYSEDNSETKLSQNTTLLMPKSHGNSRNRKACFVCKSLTHLIKDCDYHDKKMAQTPTRNHVPRENHQQYANMKLLNPQRHVAPPVVLTKSKLVPIAAVRPVTAIVLKPHVTKPRPVKPIVTKSHSPRRRHIIRNPSPKASNFPPKVTAVKVPRVNAAKGVHVSNGLGPKEKLTILSLVQGNPQHALKDKGVIDSGCLRHMTGNMSYLSNFDELNGNYVAFGGNPKGGKISGKGKFGRKFDEGFLVGYSVNIKAFRVFNSRARIIQETLQINFLENEPNVAGSGPTWLFDIDTLTKTMNYQPVTAGNQSNPSNTDGDAAFEVKEPKLEGRKPQSEVHVSPSSSAQTKKHDDKTKREAKGKSPINTAGPLNVVVSPTYGNSSHMDSSQYPGDHKMPELEDITYFDDEEDVGAEADFTNLETSIIVSPIPTTRVHKDHPVTQIIGDLSSATQTRSMTRVAQDQGELSQINNDDFHTCMFACFLSQEEPKRVHQALKDPSWIKAMQEELLQFKMQKVWVLVDLTHGKRAIGTK
nr:hypothetical protein [Tanacetum cinerariifolium]